jgi:hypothetical protein
LEIIMQRIFDSGHQQFRAGVVPDGQCDMPAVLPAQPLVFATARNLPVFRGNIFKTTKRPLRWQRRANATDGNLDGSYTKWIGEEPTMGK